MDRDQEANPVDASILMKRGIALLNENTPASLTEAVGFFDRALAMRRALAAPGDHWLAYVTAASWMNRGDALTRLGEPATIAEAVHSYDEALAVMRGVPLEIDPLYRRRLAIAWMNRGISLHQQGTAASLVAAVASFDHGIEVVRGYPEHGLLLAGAWMNRGNALLRTAPPQPADARVSARTALGLVAATEREERLAAETALKARCVLCQAVAELLARGGSEEETLEWAAEATDAVEEGMRLARHWETRGERGFRPLLVDFFRFGVAAYRVHQPHFLSEFVLEHLDPAQLSTSFSQDPEMHAVAAAALAEVARDLQTDGFATVRTPRFDRLLETLRVLQLTENRRGVLSADRRDTV